MIPLDQLLPVISGQIEAAHDEHWKARVLLAPRIHLAILREPYLGFVLDGSKWIESRFSLNRIPPFGRVGERDVLVLKASSGPVVAMAYVDRADSWEWLAGEKDHWMLLRVHSEGICADADFWTRRQGDRYATLMWLKHVRKLDPIHVTKRDQRAWVILREQQTEIGGGK
jgi:hypothetical protein